MRLDLYFIGISLCLTIIMWFGKEIWMYEETKTKFKIIYLIGMITTISGLLIPNVGAWNDCYKTGYQYCIEQTQNIKGINITSKLAISLYDETGEPYEKFVYSSFATKNFYADIYYEGDKLYYITNLTDWNETCNTETYNCQGTIISTENHTINLKLAFLHEEYIGCPLFVSLKCDDKADWCEWVGIGYIKPLNNTCSHIRIAECLYDDDCLTEQFCNRNINISWRNWSCKEKQNNQTNMTIRPTNQRGYTIMPPSKKGYIPTYTPEDLPKSFFDTITKIIRAIGNFFSGGK